MANKKIKRPNGSSNQKQNNKNTPNNKSKNNKNKPTNSQNDINEKLKQLLLEKLIEKLK